MIFSYLNYQVKLIIISNYLQKIARGYDGLYAPKPASTCLEVSDNSDGCAIFLKREKITVTSSEVPFKYFFKALNDLIYLDNNLRI